MSNQTFNINTKTILGFYILDFCRNNNCRYCLVIHDAWRFPVSLKNIGMLVPETLDDFLAIKCDSITEALDIAQKLPEEIVVSVWGGGKQLYNSLKYEREVETLDG